MKTWKYIYTQNRLVDKVNDSVHMRLDRRGLGDTDIGQRMQRMKYIYLCTFGVGKGGTFKRGRKGRADNALAQPGEAYLSYKLPSIQTATMYLSEGVREARSPILS